MYKEVVSLAHFKMQFYFESFWLLIEQGPGVVDGQGSLAYCSLWGHRVGHNWTTELNGINN